MAQSMANTIAPTGQNLLLFVSSIIHVCSLRLRSDFIHYRNRPTTGDLYHFADSESKNQLHGKGTFYEVIWWGRVSFKLDSLFISHEAESDKRQKIWLQPDYTRIKYFFILRVKWLHDQKWFRNVFWELKSGQISLNPWTRPFELWL